MDEEKIEDGVGDGTDDGLDFLDADVLKVSA